jgi:hypothetical protein
MCKEMTDEQLRLLEETEDPCELRRLLDELGTCGDCSLKSESKGDDIPCCVHHSMRFGNLLFHIFEKMRIS